MIAFLLSLTAIIAYVFGSLRTDIIASQLVFHRNLLKYSRDNVGITRFIKDCGIWGLPLVFGIEAAKIAIPVIIGGLLMSTQEQALLGRTFALFCAMMGTTFPILYEFKGEHSLVVMLVGILFVSPELFIVTAIVFGLVYYFSRYISLSAIAAAFTAYVFSIISLDGAWVHRLLLFCFVIVIIEYRKNILNLIKGKEKKFTYKKDVSYMFDDDF